MPVKNYQVDHHTPSSEVDAIRVQLRNAGRKGRRSQLGTFIKLSGPGWMQSALSLGGGSLAASLYLGIIGGTSFLWLQPVAVLMGVIMLSAVSYVVLSTGKNPFTLLNDHFGPVIAWGWLLGAGVACVVWAFPQFSLATAVVRENMLPGLLGPEGVVGAGASHLIIGLTLALIALGLVWAYDAGIGAARIFDYVLKGLVGVMFLAFFGVLIRVALEGDGIAWMEVAEGLVPKITMLTSPGDAFLPFIQAVEPQYRSYWNELIAGEQRDLLISTAAIVVGVNSTVLLSYSVLKKGWDRDFRGLAIFDLSTGFFIPFVLITGCMVIVSAAMFHAEPVEGLLDEHVTTSPRIEGRFEALKRNRVIYEIQMEGSVASPAEITRRLANLPEADITLAAMLVDRDAFDLSRTLRPLTGDVFSHYIFGIGVLGLALSTIIIQMIIWGFVTCEILGVPKHGWAYRLGALPPVLGMLAPFIWTGRAQFWLVVPTSLFVAILLPIAYFSFAFLMNSEKVLGKDVPRGMRRIVWNVLMSLAAFFASVGCVWSMWSRVGAWSIPIIIAFILLAYAAKVFSVDYLRPR